jgi:hypothetical protein
VASLSSHLQRLENHGRLAFHPECPICRRERLTGVLTSEGVVTRRATAALVAGLLATSGAAPSAVAAQEPDQQTEGTAMPEEVQGSDPALSPEFDPGGDSIDLPFDAPPVPQAPAPPDPSSDDAAPLEEEPQTDAEVPVADPGDEPAEVDGQLVLAPPAATPSPTTPAPTEAPPPATSVPPATPPAEAPVSAPTPNGDDMSESRPVRAAPRERRGSRRANERGATHVVSIVSNEEPGSPAAPSTDVQPQAEAVPVAMTIASERDRADPNDRFHVVAPGESLWSIARDLLGRDASAARIAREVNRLWELNKTRIGTGDPDLLMAGTRLRLR